MAESQSINSPRGVNGEIRNAAREAPPPFRGGGTPIRMVGTRKGTKKAYSTPPEVEAAPVHHVVSRTTNELQRRDTAAPRPCNPEGRPGLPRVERSARRSLQASLDRESEWGNEVPKKIPRPAEESGKSTYRTPRVKGVRRFADPSRTRLAPPEGWAKEMDAKIAELLQWKEHGDLPEVPEIAVTPPFTQRIMREPLPPNFKPPSVERFDGSEDPQEHIMAYQATMMLIGSSEATMCRAFFSTLTGQAQRWFTSLKGNSIDSFRDLAVKFITRFMRGKRHRKHFTHLTTVKQGTEESLTDFLVRWRAEEADVGNLDDQSAIVMFIDALKAGELYKALRRKTPRTYAALMAKADRYAEAEEANRLKGGREENFASKPRMEGPVKKKGTSPSEEKNPSNKGEGVSSSDPQNPPGVQRVSPPWAIRLPAKAPLAAPLTPLRARPSEILAYAEECQLVKPTEQGYIAVPDQGKYCRYHRRYGHSTDECQAWRKEIEALVQSGQLGNYIDWNRMHHGSMWKRGSGEHSRYPGPSEDKIAKEPTDKGKRPVINVIFGGWIPAGTEEDYVGLVEESPGPKRRRRESITFSDNDLLVKGASPRDTLVISMGVNGTVVKRVLVDTGSSVNVMYHEVFTKLGFAPDQLRPIKTPLAGFTGDTIETEGSIRLPVELGVPPNSLETEMDFVVVRITCAHNIILGRPGLAGIGGIVSLGHLCLKFYTPGGIGVARGDQQLARDCYQKACQRLGE